jgi:hypothetical protein
MIGRDMLDDVVFTLEPVDPNCLGTPTIVDSTGSDDDVKMTDLMGDHPLTAGYSSYT